MEYLYEEVTTFFYGEPEHLYLGFFPVSWFSFWNIVLLFGLLAVVLAVIAFVLVLSQTYDEFVGAEGEVLKSTKVPLREAIRHKGTLKLATASSALVLVSVSVLAMVGMTIVVGIQGFFLTFFG